jgi:catechol 2,3-dioxygenase-like lactoylglutathione lyase family enzyme
MKRLHLHIRVDDLAASARFYETLLGAAPDVVRPDYAQWNLDDPSVNLAISTVGEHRERTAGIDHVGIQVVDEAELADVTGRLRQAEQALFEEKGNPCCYAVGAKSWASDPQGVIWETFARLGGADDMGADAERDARIDALRRKAAAGGTDTAGPVARCCG